MVLADGEGIPLGVQLESASPAEITLAETTLAEVSVPQSRGRPRQKPERIIADAGYDSDPLRRRLRKRGIELIAPYRKNNKKRRYEDGRKLRRYKRRWIVERTNAWLGEFRRLLVRHEHLLSIYYAFSILLASGSRFGGIFETPSSKPATIHVAAGEHDKPVLCSSLQRRVQSGQGSLETVLTQRKVKGGGKTASVDD